MSSKATYILGYEDGRERRSRDSKSFWTQQEKASYAEGYDLGRKTGPYEPRHNAGHQRKAMAAKRLQPNTPIEVNMFGTWVAGIVTHDGGGFFIFTGGRHWGVLVDRPAYWRLPPGECCHCGKGIERGEDDVASVLEEPESLEHKSCARSAAEEAARSATAVALLPPGAAA